MIASLVLTAVVAQTGYVRSRVDDAVANSACLYWLEGSTIEWRQNQRGNPETGDSVFTAAEAAVATWQSQLDGCGNVTFKEGARTATTQAGFRGDGTDENVVVYRQKKCSALISSTDACWAEGTCGSLHDCWDHSSGAIAITTTSFHPTSGRLYDADIELNMPSYVFSTVDAPVCVAPNYQTTCVSTDVQNTLTHELGHVLGLGHINVAGSTMQPKADPGELSKRVLDTGTKQFVCDVYPKGKPSKSCVLPPVSTSLGKSAGGCAAAPGELLTALLGVGVLAWPRRRRRRA